MASDPMKVIILGNSGVGKSFLANLLVGEDKFEHQYQPTSCTSKVEFELTIIGGNDEELIVYNIPGLIEANEANLKRNKDAIKKAFEHQPRQRTVVLFVFDGSRGGRITNDDCAAWNAVNKFLQVEAKHYGAAIGFVVNNLDRKAVCRGVSATDAERKVADHCAATTRTLKELCGERAFSGKVVFVDAIGDDDVKTMTSQPMARASEVLMQAVEDLAPKAAVITIDKNAEIVLEREKYEREVKEMVARMEALREQHERDMRAQSAEHKAAIATIRDDQQRLAERHAEELAGIRRELERSAAEVERYKRELDEARARGNSDGLDGNASLLYALLGRQRELEFATPMFDFEDSPRRSSHRSSHSRFEIEDAPRRSHDSSRSHHHSRSHQHSRRHHSPGGALNWNSWRSAAKNTYGHMSRSEQSQMYKNYKKTGDF